MQTVEQLAPTAIAGLIPCLTAPAIRGMIPTLTQLTTEQPTTIEIEEAMRVSKAITAEIEDALKSSKAITRACFEWLAARYSARAQSEAALNPGLQALRNMGVEFVSGVPVASEAEDAELDRVEQLQAERGLRMPA